MLFARRSAIDEIGVPCCTSAVSCAIGSEEPVAPAFAGVSIDKTFANAALAATAPEAENQSVDPNALDALWNMDCTLCAG